MQLLVYTGSMSKILLKQPAAVDSFTLAMCGNPVITVDKVKPLAIL